MGNAIKLIMTFVLGFCSCAFIILFLSSGIQTPLSVGSFSLVKGESFAPGDWIKQNQIQVESDKIVINVPNAKLARYAPTGSMRPVLDYNSNGIIITPSSADEINVGDIITFKQGSDLIVHRVVEKGEDEQGVWFVTRGDNNAVTDGKVYFKDVEYVTIGVLY